MSSADPATTSPAPPTRALRADARRNREKVLRAAREVFADDGLDAQMDDVARRADVGVGTVYRHFPTKDELLQALIGELFDVVAERGREALEAENAWEALVDLLWYAGETTTGDRAFTQIMAARGGPPRACPPQRELIGILAELVRRAQAEGRMRPDVIVDDLPMLMCGVGGATAMRHARPDAWRRHLAIILDGLRADCATGRLPC